MKYGYYPTDKVDAESVSRTLESVYDDYAAATMAGLMGKKEDAEYFGKRSEFYKNLFDKETQFMRPRYADGCWKTPFNPSDLAHAESRGGDYTEGNAWQYTWHVQHDVPGLIELFGGKEVFLNKLDSLFTIELKGSGLALSLIHISLRQASVDAPKIIMIEFFSRWLFKRIYLTTLRIDAGHHMLDRPVLSGSIHCLKNNEDSITVLRIQLILQRGKFSYVFSQQCLGLRFGQITGIASIKLRNAMFLTGLGQQSLQDFLFHSANQLIILTSSFSNRLPIR